MANPIPFAAVAGSGASGCGQQLPCPGERVVALPWGDLNPLTWLGAGAASAATDAWTSAMTALWSAGLWLLDLAFKIIDAFTTPDLSATGPLADVLPYTFAIGGFVAVLMAFVQIGVALYRRDGQSLARIMVGVLQFGAVWIGYLAIAATLVTATAGLTTGLLQAMVHVGSFSGYSLSASWPRNIDDTVVATVLGLCTVFLIFPAAIGYITLMLVREAALLLLTATSPISAAGLLSEGTRAWFWKNLRWFLATVLMTPLAALVLGIGVQISQGVVQGNGDKTAAAVGVAVTGSILVLIGAVCPLILFRLLAFVDPGTSSGAAMRQSLAANGGIAGLLGARRGGGDSAGGSTGAGSGAATQQDSHGRSEGESSADSATQSRFAGVLGGLGQGAQAGAKALSRVASTATSVGSDVLGSAGVGHQAPYFGPTDSGSDTGSKAGGGRPASGEGVPGAGPAADGSAGGPADGGQPPGGAGDQPGGDGPQVPHRPTPPVTPPPTHGSGAGAPQPPGSPGATGAGGGGAAGGAGAAGAGEVPVVPV